MVIDLLFLHGKFYAHVLLQVKIWFQNRRTKWKKQENISNAEAAEHKIGGPRHGPKAAVNTENAIKTEPDANDKVASTQKQPSMTNLSQKTTATAMPQQQTHGHMCWMCQCTRHVFYIPVVSPIWTGKKPPILLKLLIHQQDMPTVWTAMEITCQQL